MDRWFRYWAWHINESGNYGRGVVLADCRECGEPITDLAIREGVASERDGRCARCGLEGFAKKIEQ